MSRSVLASVLPATRRVAFCAQLAVFNWLWELLGCWLVLVTDGMPISRRQMVKAGLAAGVPRRPSRDARYGGTVVRWAGGTVGG